MVIPTCYFTDEVSDDIAESLRLGREAGAQAVELRSRLFGKRVDQLDSDELAHLSELLTRNSLGTACIASSFGKCDLNSEEEWAEHQDILRGSVRAAQALGTPVVRVFPFWTPGRQDLPRPGLSLYLDRIVDRYQWAVTEAEREGVFLCFETEAATHSGTCAEVSEIIEALGGSKALAVAWDANNAWLAGCEEPLTRCYPLIRGRVRHLHVKPNQDGNISSVAGSSVSYADVLRQLMADGYEGAAGIEHWGSPEAMLDGVKQLRDLLDTLQ